MNEATSSPPIRISEKQFWNQLAKPDIRKMLEETLANNLQFCRENFVHH